MNTSTIGRQLGGALAIAAIALAPGVVAAQEIACARWDVGGGWTAEQGRLRVDFDLRQRDGVLSGTGQVLRQTGRIYVPVHAPMPVSGSIRGASIVVETSWGGVYVGSIDSTGRIAGRTYDRRDSLSEAAWGSDRRLNCLMRVGAPVPSTAGSVGVGVGRTGGAYGLLGSGTRVGSAAPARPVPTATLPMPAPPVVAPQSPVATPAATTAAPVPNTGRSCRAGFVRRSAGPGDRVCVTPASHARVLAENASRLARVQPGGGAWGPNTCRAGYVWREAFAGDGVCVTPAIRALVLHENRLAEHRGR